MRTFHRNEKPVLSVEDFARQAPAELKVELIAGAAGAQTRSITSARIQKLGLALAGFSHYIHPGRMQIVGQSEIGYLEQLEPESRRKAILNLDLENICCILLTKSLEPTRELTEIADEFKLPVLRTPQVSSIAIAVVSNFLQEALAPQITLHGVLMELYGIGVLLLGESGIGKSECALDLITRGHRLISDYTVMVKRIGEKLEGISPEIIQGHLEIRGLGIINVKDLFGVSAVGNNKSIDLCIHLKAWNSVDEIDRLGADTHTEDIFGVQVPKVILPISPGRNTSTLVETAVRVQLLRQGGYDGAQKFIERHTEMLRREAQQNEARQKF
jgi:HPr kinase/phosphorylase